MNNRYTDNGTIFVKKGIDMDDSWAVQLNCVTGGGAPFKVIKWATWYNNHMPFGLQETNEAVPMFGWTIATKTDLVLFGDKQIVDNVEKILALVRLGYKGQHATSEIVMAEIEWKMSQ